MKNLVYIVILIFIGVFLPGCPGLIIPVATEIGKDTCLFFASRPSDSDHRIFLNDIVGTYSVNDITIFVQKARKDSNNFFALSAYRGKKIEENKLFARIYSGKYDENATVLETINFFKSQGYDLDPPVAATPAAPPLASSEIPTAGFH